MAHVEAHRTDYLPMQSLGATAGRPSFLPLVSGDPTASADPTAGDRIRGQALARRRQHARAPGRRRHRHGAGVSDDSSHEMRSPLDRACGDRLHGYVITEADRSRQGLSAPNRAG